MKPHLTVSSSDTRAHDQAAWRLRNASAESIGRYMETGELPPLGEVQQRPRRGYVQSYTANRRSSFSVR